MGRVALISLGIAATSVLGACSLTATMIPVQGPLSQTSPVPILSVKVDGIMGSSGKIRFALPDGEQCSGRWSSAAGTGATYAAGSLLSKYGSTYISGFSVSSGSGQVPGSALATCSKGRVFQLDFVHGDGSPHGFGIAKDSVENIYRFVF